MSKSGYRETAEYWTERNISNSASGVTRHWIRCDVCPGLHILMYYIASINNAISCRPAFMLKSSVFV